MTPLPAEQEGGPTLWQWLLHWQMSAEYAPLVAIAMAALFILLVRLVDRRQ